MTLEQVRALTPEEKRIKCAEARGWFDFANDDDGVLMGRTQSPGEWSTYTVVPDPANDANAALQLCIYLAEKGYAVRLSKHMQWTCIFSRNLPRSIKIASADTLPSAIVDAFLMTVLP